MNKINVPDLDGPTAQLCWTQKLDPPGAMTRCDRRKGHYGPHSWDHRLTGELCDLLVPMPDTQVDEILAFIATLRDARKLRAEPVAAPSPQSEAVAIITELMRFWPKPDATERVGCDCANCKLGARIEAYLATEGAAMTDPAPARPIEVEWLALPPDPPKETL